MSGTLERGSVRSWRWPLTRSPRSRCAGREIEGVLVGVDRRAAADPRSGCRRRRSTAPARRPGPPAWRPRSTARRCCGAGGRAGGARVAGIGRRRRVHRIVVQPAGDVDGGDETHAARDRAAGPERDAVEAVVERAAERTVGLDGGAALPRIAGIAGDDVDQAGQRLAVARGEPVGDQRRLAQEIGRDAEAESAARGVELVLDAEPVEDERLLADPAAPVALPHRSRAQRDRLLQRAHRQVPKVRGADLLLGARGQRIEQLVDRRGDHERRQLDGARPSSSKSARIVAPARTKTLSSTTPRKPMSRAATWCQPVRTARTRYPPRGVGDGADPVVHQHLGRRRASGRCRASCTRPSMAPSAWAASPRTHPSRAGRGHERRAQARADASWGGEQEEVARPADGRVRDGPPVAGSKTVVMITGYPSATTRSPLGARTGRRKRCGSSSSVSSAPDARSTTWTNPPLSHWICPEGGIGHHVHPPADDRRQPPARHVHVPRDARGAEVVRDALVAGREHAPVDMRCRRSG